MKNLIMTAVVALFVGNLALAVEDSYDQDTLMDDSHETILHDDHDEVVQCSAMSGYSTYRGYGPTLKSAKKAALMECEARTTHPTDKCKIRCCR